MPKGSRLKTETENAFGGCLIFVLIVFGIVVLLVAFGYCANS